MGPRGAQHGRVVPWASWAEWKAAKDDLLDARDPNRHARGIARVACWRCRGRVPVAVDATADLVETKLQGCFSDKFAAVSAYTQRLTLSMAIVRLVNGIAGALQKGAYATSVASLAERAGMPRILVDIRHEASHNVLPSLAILQIAADQAVAWLRDGYWNVQEAELGKRRDHIRGIVEQLLDASEGAKSGASASDKMTFARTAAEDDPSKRVRSKLLKELLELVPEALASQIASQVQAVVKSKGFAANQSKAWKVVLGKLYKHWPSLPLVLLESCWEDLKRPVPAASAHTQTQWQSLEAFVGWSLGCWESFWSTEGMHMGDFQSILCDIVLDCIQMSQTNADQGDTGRRNCFAEIRDGCLRTLSALEKDNRMDASTSTRLQFLKRLAGKESAVEGPTISFASVFGKEKLLGGRTCSEAVKARVQTIKERGGAGGSTGGEVTPRPRWSRCVDWKPCAIGNLPSRGNRNGRLPFKFEVPNLEANAEFFDGSADAPDDARIASSTPHGEPAPPTASWVSGGNSGEKQSPFPAAEDPCDPAPGASAEGGKPAEERTMLERPCKLAKMDVGELKDSVKVLL